LHGLGDTVELCQGGEEVTLAVVDVAHTRIIAHSAKIASTNIDIFVTFFGSYNLRIIGLLSG
jgi:hypothetical protein